VETTLGAVMAIDVYTIGAKYYDGAYQNNPNLNDVPFYLDLAQQCGGPVLEIACGTGRVLLEIARKGIEIWGIDLSVEQLSILDAKLRTEPESIRALVQITKADMRTFDLGRKFRLVTIPFRAMQHMYSIDDQIRAMNTAKKHLMPDGVLAFDVFCPDYSMLLQTSGEEMFEVEWPAADDSRRVVRRYFKRTRVDLVRQYFEGEFIFRTCEGEQVIAEERSTFKMGYYTYPQLLLLFRHCGLEVVEEFGSFGREPVEIGRELIFILKSAT
jgi:SAM-dependent methyltransferase